MQLAELPREGFEGVYEKFRESSWLKQRRLELEDPRPVHPWNRDVTYFDRH